MKKSETYRSQMDALQSKITEAFNKFVESMSEEDKKAWKSLDEAYAEVEESYNEALRTEALDQPQHGASQEEKEATRGEKKSQMTEEVTNFIKGLRESITYGTRFSGTIPVEIATQIQYKKELTAKVKNYCTVHKVSGDYSLTVEGDEVTVDYFESTYAESDVSPDALKLSALDFGAIGKLNNNVIKDAAVDLVDYIATIFGKAIAKKEDHEILFGIGTASNTKKIRGVAATGTAATVVTAAGQDTVTLEEILTTIGKIRAYKVGATMFISGEMDDLLHTFKDKQGKYIFDPTTEITSIRGVKVVVSDQMPALTQGNAAMIVGNFQYYHVADRQTMEIKVLDQVYAKNGKTGFLVNERIDGDFVGEAFAVLKLAEAA